MLLFRLPIPNCQVHIVILVMLTPHLTSQVTQMEGIGAVRGREQIHPAYLFISIIVGSPALVISGQFMLSVTSVTQYTNILIIT